MMMTMIDFLDFITARHAGTIVQVAGSPVRKSSSFHKVVEPALAWCEEARNDAYDSNSSPNT